MAGFGLALFEVRDLTTRNPGPALEWLTARLRTQTRFWEEEAPDGARSGNLRAWAALAAAVTSAMTDDPTLRYWAAWSASNVLCSANADGSLPQEMRRGPRALQYQLHALAPLTVTALLLDRQGSPIAAVCDNALDRAVRFAVDDLASGQATLAITGEVQTFFDGSDSLEGWHISWIEAYLRLGSASDPATLNRLADPLRPLRYSKLGGDQALIWADF